MITEILKDKLAILPDTFGCYIYKDKNGEIIYVGKSKSLKKRVNSYFRGAHDLKTTLLVSEIADIEFVVTKNELEALVLELNLIKQYEPKYNIKLNDDSTYPYIQITNETHPRLIVTRQPKKKHGKVFGPFPSAYAAQETVKMLNKVYPLRMCAKMPKVACLYYHMGQCLAPCIKEIDVSIYDKIKDEIYNFLKGDTKSVVTYLKEMMSSASEKLEFEKAKEYRDLIEHINKTVEKQQISLNDFIDRDVFGCYISDELITISIFFMRQGKVVTRDIHTSDYYDDPKEAYFNFIAQYYKNTNHPVPKEVIVQFSNYSTLQELLKTKIIQPKKGNKYKLLMTAIDNATVMMEQEALLFKRVQDRTVNANSDLRELLNMEKLKRIEAFDNSNLMGVDAVSAMVVYENGKPNKKLYRRYKVKTVSGPDDYKTMREVIYRRYFKVLSEDLERPDLIIIDGGKGHLTASLEVINSLGMEIEVIGLKKDSNHITTAIVTRDKEIELDRKSNLYKLLSHIQEEVHRYAISYHRKVRQKSISSVLDEIDGIGPKRRRLLYKKFSSLTDIKNTTVKELINIGLTKKLSVRILEKLNNYSKTEK